MRIVTINGRDSRQAGSGTAIGSAGRSGLRKHIPGAEDRTRRAGQNYRTHASPASPIAIGVLGGLLTLAGTLPMGGCATPARATVPADGPAEMPSERVVRGDWDDADAAVRTGVRREQMAIESRREYRSVEDEDATVIVYHLRTVRGDSGDLTLKRLAGDEILVRCRIGAMGSEGAEAALVSEVSKRLRALAGRDYRPLDG
jgi:hypothetical protein